ncbi:UNVERIFIED_CONTAM: hypothetical protein FKN15_045115 [Acipenser sinensis]
MVRQFLESPNPPDQVFAGCRDPEGPRAKCLKDLSKKHSERLFIVQLDTTDPVSIKEAAKQVESKLNKRGLNLLINNAAINLHRTLDETDSDDMMRCYKTNVVGPMLMAKAALNMLTQCLSEDFRKEEILCNAIHPGWVKTDMGGKEEFLPCLKMAAQSSDLQGMCCRKAAVINLSTLVASIEKCPETFGMAPLYPYRTSKAALNMLTQCLSEDFRKEEILCNAIHPGWVKTDMGGKEAPLDVVDSVVGVFQVLSALTEKTAGQCLDWEGKIIPCMIVRFCPHCGTKIEAGFKFCPSCGVMLPQQDPEETVTDSISQMVSHASPCSASCSTGQGSHIDLPPCSPLCTTPRKRVLFASIKEEEEKHVAESSVVSKSASADQSSPLSVTSRSPLQTSCCARKRPGSSRVKEKDVHSSEPSPSPRSKAQGKQGEPFTFCLSHSKDTPTKELGDHSASSNSHVSEFSSPGYLNRFTHSESSTDEEGGGFEWDDDFSSPEPSFISKAASHLIISKASSPVSSRYFSPPPPPHTMEQSWASSSPYSRFSISPASIASFSLTHLTDSDVEQGALANFSTTTTTPSRCLQPTACRKCQCQPLQRLPENCCAETGLQNKGIACAE